MLIAVGKSDDVIQLGHPHIQSATKDVCICLHGLVGWEEIKPSVAAPLSHPGEL